MNIDLVHGSVLYTKLRFGVYMEIRQLRIILQVIDGYLIVILFHSYVCIFKEEIFYFSFPLEVQIIFKFSFRAFNSRLRNDYG